MGEPCVVAARTSWNAANTREITRLRAEGRELIGQLSERDLLIAGTALYAGEGAKTDGKVKFANSDARQVALFCRWLRTFFDVDESRLRVALYLHAHLDLTAAIDHWAGVTGIPPEQFTKPYRAVPDESIRHTKHRYGCVGVAYHCSRTHRGIMGLVDGLLDRDLVGGRLSAVSPASLGADLGPG